jgi:undecaprenyl-diphosphatase
MFLRWVAVDSGVLARNAWRGITLLGGATLTIGMALAAILMGKGALHDAGVQAAITLALTHIAAQLLKRTITRPRPSGMSFEALVAAPDRFSFPSGHAIAASSLAFVFSWNFPAFAPALLILATLVAVSRVRLGVHYPGDVVAGQIIALVGAMAVVTLR